MATYDLTDETIIDARPDVVYRAIVDEMDGKTHWAEPVRTNVLRTGESFSAVGAVIDSTIQIHRRMPIRFTTKTAAVRPGEMIRVDYIGGSFRGEGTWRFERAGDRTKLSYRWQTTPSGPLRYLAPVLPVGRSHTTATRAEFEKLKEFLES